MPENTPQLTPSSAPSSTPTTPRGPDFGSEVRAAIPGIEQAIEVHSETSSGSSPADPQGTSPKAPLPPSDASPTLPRAIPVESLPKEVLIKRTASLLKAKIDELDKQARELMQSKSRSRAHDLTALMQQMRSLQINLIRLYRMALGNVRELYQRLRG